MSEHRLVPENPKNGEQFSCPCCGYSASFVVLDDGLPGEWINTTPRDPRYDQEANER